MPRVTESAVKAILDPGEDCDDIALLTPFLEAASTLVDSVVSVGATHGRLGLTLSTKQQAQLETWLAAAMYCFSDQQVQSQNAGGANVTYSGNGGEFLETNRYGRMACMIDVTRVLKPLVEGRVAGFAWLGKVPSNQIPYSQRN